MRLLKWIKRDVPGSKGWSTDQKQPTIRDLDPRMMGSLYFLLYRWVTRYLVNGENSSIWFFPTTLFCFFLLIGLNVRLNNRSNDRKEKKSTYTFIVLTCSPCSTLIWPADHVVLFFVSRCTGGTAVFEILGSHGMGEGRADCTKSLHSSRLHATLWKYISDIKNSNHCHLRLDKHRKIGAWWIFTWADVTSRQSH